MPLVKTSESRTKSIINFLRIINPFNIERLKHAGDNAAAIRGTAADPRANLNKAHDRLQAYRKEKYPEQYAQHKAVDDARKQQNLLVSPERELEQLHTGSMNMISRSQAALEKEINKALGRSGESRLVLNKEPILYKSKRKNSNVDVGYNEIPAASATAMGDPITAARSGELVRDPNSRWSRARAALRRGWNRYWGLNNNRSGNLIYVDDTPDVAFEGTTKHGINLNRENVLRHEGMELVQANNNKIQFLRKIDRKGIPIQSLIDGTGKVPENIRKEFNYLFTSKINPKNIQTMKTPGSTSFVVDSNGNSIASHTNPRVIAGELKSYNRVQNEENIPTGKIYLRQNRSLEPDYFAGIVANKQAGGTGPIKIDSGTSVYNQPLGNREIRAIGNVKSNSTYPGAPDYKIFRMPAEEESRIRGMNKGQVPESLKSIQGILDPAQTGRPKVVMQPNNQANYAPYIGLGAAGAGAAAGAGLASPTPAK